MVKNIRKSVTVKVEKDTVVINHSIEKTKMYWLFTMVCFICGIFGILQSLTSTFSLTYNQPMVYITLGTSIICVWAVCFGRMKRLRYLFLGWCSFFSITFFFLFQQFPYFLHGFKLNVVNMYGIHLDFFNTKPGDTTVFVIMLLSIFGLFMYYLIFERRNKSAIICIPLLVLLLELLVDKKPTINSASLLVLFCFGTNALLGKKHKKDVIDLSKNKKNARSFSGAITCGWIVFLLLSLTIGSNPEMEKIVFDVNSFVKNILYTFVPDLEDSFLTNVDVNIDNGHINRGNLLQTNRKELLLTTNKQPKETIYIKGYTGSTYDGNRWQEIDENSFFRKSYDTGYERRWNEVTHKSYYLTKPLDSDPMVNQLELQIVKLRKNDYELYAPYISSLESQEGDTFNFVFYEQQDFKAITKDNVDQNATEIEMSYRDYVTEQYLEVPNERITRIIKLCENNNFTKLEDITSFIKKTLNDNTTYTIRPGSMPPDAEITEYFLFESKQGYCVHYATTATLMYRLYGIPARYVTGYVAAPKEFKEQDDGHFKVELTDKSAHAWVEIYDPAIGWYPVEVTSRNVAGNRQSNSNATNQETNQTSKNENSEKEKPTSQTPEIDTDKDQTTNQFSSFIKILENNKNVIYTGVSIFGIGLCISYHRKKKIIKIQTESVGKQFKRMLILLHSAKYMKEYTGLEDDFIATWLATIPNVTKNETIKMMQILYKEAYSDLPIEEEERKFIYEIYAKVYQVSTKKMNIFKYWYYKYINVQF